ncbi:hypothetical protein KQX64_02940 [Rhodopseudomonas palustris]|nr:hypothetical protein KQX64_02940 [Rhodopseudomonas palustris]
MKQALLAALCCAAIGTFAGTASAQTTGPAPQDWTKMNNGMSGGSPGMSDNGMSKGSTQGMATSKSKKHSSKKNDVQPSSMSKGPAK